MQALLCASPRLHPADRDFLTPVPMNGEQDHLERLPRVETPEATFERTRQTQERRPPVDLVVSLSSLFFWHIHPWFAFLDIQHVYVEMGSSEDPTLLQYALFGVSLPYSFDSRLDQKSSDSYWKYSKRRIFMESLEEPSYSSLEALIVLALDLSGMTNGPQVWGVLTVAIKLAAQLRNVGGLVFRTSVPDNATESLGEMDKICRQKLFWALYTLDCYITLTTGHSSDLRDDLISHFLATRPQIWPKTSIPKGIVDHMALFPTIISGYHLELLDISRKVHQVHINHAALRDDKESSFPWLDQFQKCSAELIEWAHSLPSCLYFSNIKDMRRPSMIRMLPSLVMLHAFYHALVIHLHGLLSHSTYAAPQSPPSEDDRRESQSRCLHSISVLIDIVSEWMDKIGDKLGWPLAWSMWVAVRYLLVHESSGGNSQVGNITTMLNFLRKMGRYWQISGKYWRLLRQAFVELQTKGTSNQRRLQGILQFVTDLRVSTSDLEDQFRVDPVLHSGRATQVQTAVTCEDGSLNAPVQGRQGVQGVLSDDTYFSDNWFQAPLFASSAYLQDFPAVSPEGNGCLQYGGTG